MTDTQKRELEAFLAEQKLIGGLNPSKLDHDTVIWIDTDTFMFKVTVDKSYGSPKYVIETGSPRMSGAPCVSVNSFYPRLNYTMRDYLGLGLKLMFEHSNSSILYSGTIKGVSVSGEGYNYELWK